MGISRCQITFKLEKKEVQVVSCQARYNGLEQCVIRANDPRQRKLCTILRHGNLPSKFDEGMRSIAADDCLFFFVPSHHLEAFRLSFPTRPEKSKYLSVGKRNWPSNTGWSPRIELAVSQNRYIIVVTGSMVAYRFDAVTFEWEQLPSLHRTSGSFVCCATVRYVLVYG